jgi:hypothetical protein
MPIRITRRGGLWIPVCAAILSTMALVPGPTRAADPCTCEHRESIRQELENALYEAQFFTALSKRLREVQQRQIEVDKDPTHRDSGLSVLAVSAQARAAIMARNSSSRIQR